MQSYEMSSIFGELTMVQRTGIDRSKDISNLMKYVNCVSVNKAQENEYNIFKSSQKNDESLTALKATADYSLEPVEHKINVMK